jgi:hypothetical protein
MARPAFKFRGIQKNSEDFGSFFRTMKCLTGIASNIMSKSAERKEETSQMHRYVVESSFPDGLNIPINNDGARICGGVASRNAVGQVPGSNRLFPQTGSRLFAFYDAPSPEAIPQPRNPCSPSTRSPKSVFSTPISITDCVRFFARGLERHTKKKC